MARVFDLAQTKTGVFEVRGIVSGTEGQRFFTEKKTKNGGTFRSTNFGVMYDENKTVYVNLNGMTRDKVYFSKRVDGKTETKAVPWANRAKFNEDGYRIIGTNLGIVKTTDNSGKPVNDKKTMVEFDAVQYIKDNLVDDVSVFIRGNIEHQSYTDKNGDTRRSVRYVPSQISLCQDVYFDEYNDDPNDKKNKPRHHFTETIIFMGIEQEKDDNDKATGRFIVMAKVVTYSGIEDVEYIIADKALASIFKKNMKAYWSIEVSGKIEVSHQVEEVAEDDGWGETNVMTQRQTGSSKVELVITGAAPSTIDKETYSEKNISEAMKKINASKNATAQYGDKTDDSAPWGESNDSESDEDW